MSGEMKRVLVTGANGFIASHAVGQLLKRGYFVRGTVRSSAKAELLKSKFLEHKDKLELVVKEDFTTASAYDGLLQGLSGIFHIASPIALSSDKGNKEQFIDPAIQNTLAVLEAAVKVPSIKRVIITSSFAAVRDMAKTSEYVFTEKDWNPITEEQAITAPSLLGYMASKKLAEKSAWDFVESKKPNFDLITICPPMVFGPNTYQNIEKLAELNASSKYMYDIVYGGKPLDTISDVYVDVRDCALSHILAFEKAKGNQRYLVAAGNFNFQQLADLVHKEFPQITTTQVGAPGVNPPIKYRVNNQKSVSELGLSYISRDDTFRDSVREFLDLHRKGKLQ